MYDYTARELLGDALLKETLKDEWLLRLDPETAHVLLKTAVIPGKSYRRNGDGDLHWARLSAAFDNRHIDNSRVRNYSRKMLTTAPDGSCEWVDRITDIGITPDGVLAMGFHTCLAVVLSGTTHEVRLLANFTESERDSEGTGRKQDFGDVLYRKGVVNARSAAALIQIMANHRRTRSPLNSITPGSQRNTMTELVTLLTSEEMPLINEAVSYGKDLSARFYSSTGKYKKRSAIAPAMIAHLYLEWMQQHPAEAWSFFEGLKSGQGISGPVLLLRERFSAIATTGGTPLDGILNAHIRTASLAGLAWRAYLSGDYLSKLQLSNPPVPLFCEVHHP